MELLRRWVAVASCLFVFVCGCDAGVVLSPDSGLLEPGETDDGVSLDDDADTDDPDPTDIGDLPPDSMSPEEDPIDGGETQPMDDPDGGPDAAVDDASVAPDDAPPDDPDVVFPDDAEGKFPPDAPSEGLPSFRCEAPASRRFPMAEAEFQALYRDIEPNVQTWARAGTTLGNQRLEAPLDALVQAYEATGHPYYATKFLNVVEMLRAAAVRNDPRHPRYIAKSNCEVVTRDGLASLGRRDDHGRCVAHTTAYWRDVTAASARASLCPDTGSCARGQMLADAYIAEPIYRGLRTILRADGCFLSHRSGLYLRARRQWDFFARVLWQAWRNTAAFQTQNQELHVLARTGQMAYQVCLYNRTAYASACAFAQRNAAIVRDAMRPLRGDSAHVVWGSTMRGAGGQCDPTNVDTGCHTLSGACGGYPGEAATDCRAASRRSDGAYCFQNFCGPPDVSHANTVVGFMLDLAQNRETSRGAQIVTDADLDRLGATLRDVIWCGSIPSRVVDTSVFIDGYPGCGVASPPSLPRRDGQRRALALGWLRLARRDPNLEPGASAMQIALAMERRPRDRTRLDTVASTLRLLATRLANGEHLLDAAGCRICRR